MAWKQLAAGLGTTALVSEFKAIEHKVSKRQYKRLLSTAIAQLIELDPDTKKGRARRWAQRAIGVKPSKKVLKQAASDVGAKEIAEAAAVAAVGAKAAKIAGKVVPRISQAAGAAVDRVRAKVEGKDASEK
jgi:hypothetical protein